MDQAITASEANQRFSKMLRDVANGASFTVTSRGRPVARVVPIAAKAQGERFRELAEHLDTLPILHAGDWKREELYD